MAIDWSQFTPVDETDDSADTQSLFGQLSSAFPDAKVSSLTRTGEHNAEVGGMPTSQHIPRDKHAFGTAMDIVVPKDQQSDFIDRASTFGLTAINEGDHIHLQRPKDGSSKVDWSKFEPVSADSTATDSPAVDWSQFQPVNGPSFGSVKGGAGVSVADKDSDYGPDFLKDFNTAQNSPNTFGSVQSGVESTNPNRIPEFSKNVIGQEGEIQQDLDNNQSTGPAARDVNGKWPWDEGYDRISGEYFSRQAAKENDDPENIRSRELERIKAQESGLDSFDKALKGTVGKGIAGISMPLAAGLAALSGNDAPLEAVSKLNKGYNKELSEADGAGAVIGQLGGGLIPSSFIGGPVAASMDILDNDGSLVDAEKENLKGALINEVTLGAGRLGSQAATKAAYAGRAGIQAGVNVGATAADRAYSGEDLTAGDVAQGVGMGLFGGLGRHVEESKQALTDRAEAAKKAAEAAGKPPWEATADALDAIKNSDSVNVPEPGFQADTGKIPEAEINGNADPQKTNSKMLPPDPQAARDADAAAAQNEAWGHLPDAEPQPTAEATTPNESHELFDDLVPEHVEDTPANAPKSALLSDPTVKPDDMGFLYRDGKLVAVPKETARGRTEAELAPERSTPEERAKHQEAHDQLNQNFNTADKAWNFLAKGKDAVATLARTILSNPRERNTTIKALSPEDLKTSRSGTEQMLGQSYGDGLDSPLGLYSSKADQVLIRGAGFRTNGLDRATLGHELLHAEILTKNKELRKLHEAIGDGSTDHLHPETAKALHAYRSLESTRDALANNPDFTEGKGVPMFYKHAVSNVDELTSVAMTDEGFRRYLKGVKMGSVSAWSKIKAAWHGIVGAKTQADKDVLDHIAEHTNTLIKYDPEAVAMARHDDFPAMAAKERPSREQIDAQAKAAIAKGANPEAVQKRVDDLYAQHGHEPAPTSTKNAVRDAERAAEGRDPILKAAAQTNAETLAKAHEAIAKNPDRPAEVIQKLNEDGVHSISAQDEAVLLIEKVRLRNARNEAANTLSDPHASEEAKTVAETRWLEHEASIAALDAATTASGQEWGRLGQLRQRMMREDFSLDAMEKKARVVNKGPLTPEQSAQVRADHERINAAQKEVAATETDHAQGVKHTYESLVKEMKGQLESAKKKGTFLETLKSNADSSRDWIKKNLGNLNAGVNPELFYHMSRVGAYHIANGAVKLKDWLMRMKKELGDAVYARMESSLPHVFEAAKAQHDTNATESKPRMKVKASLDPNNITHKDVYDLARAHINRGVHGEAAVMEAVHGDLKQHGLSERDVRRLFSEYGEVKFPSKEADKTELRELRSLVQMQESIDRLQAGQEALKSGPQRDKPTAEIREKRRQLNDLLKAQEAKSGLSPEKLATYQEARARNVRNQIEDLQREIDTGEKKVRKATPADNAEVTALKVERDRLKDELKKIEEAKNPPKSPEEKYQDRRAKTIQQHLDAIYKRIETGDYAKRVRPDRDLNKANTEALYNLNKAKDLFARHQVEMAMAKRGKADKMLGMLVETQNLSRAIMTSWDLSAFGRQGGWLVASHPIIGVKALLTSIKAMRSEKAAFAVQREIETRPNFALYRRAGLDLTLSSGHALGKHEEQFMSKWIEHDELQKGQAVRNTGRVVKNTALAGTRASERAFKVFLNKLRADTFDTMLESLSRDPSKPTKEELKAIGSYVNIGSGRGDMGKFAGAAQGLSTVFFAPRLAMSRMNLLTLKPIRIAAKASPRMRNMIMKEYVRSIVGLGAIYGVYALYHEMADKKHTDTTRLELDPRSSDFGKMKFGTATVDFSTGLAGWATFFARLGSGTTKDYQGKIQPLSYDRFSTENDKKDKGPGFGKQNAASVIGTMLRTKLSPTAGGVVDYLMGGDVTGKRATVGSIVANRSLPIPATNAVQVLKNHGIPESIALLLADVIGGGVNERGDNKQQPEKKNGN